MIKAIRVMNLCQLKQFHHILAGVLQGSILSPTLYAVFTNDISMDQDEMLALYAGVIALLSML